MNTFKSRKKVISPAKKCHKILPTFHHTASLAVVVIQLFVLFPETYSQFGRIKGCKEICDENRGKGNNLTLAYEFVDCDTVYTNPGACRDSCNSCPDFICKDSANYIFKCPRSNDYGECQKLCDKNPPYRPNGNYYPQTENFSLTCTDNQDSRRPMTANCTAVCLDCPDWICDHQVNDTLFQCLSKDFFESDCKRDCDYQRERVYGKGLYFRNKFSFSCHDEDIDSQRCQDNCGLCPDEICNPYKENITWDCPKLEPDSRPEGNGELKCLKRCDKHREGIGSYELSCNRDFPSKKEFYRCRHECSRCTEDICEINRNIRDFIFHCPPSVEIGVVFTWIIGIFTIIFVVVCVLLVVGCFFFDMKNKGVSVAVVDPAIPQQSASSIKNYASFSSTDLGATSSVANNDEVPTLSPKQSGSAVNEIQPK